MVFIYYIVYISSKIIIWFNIYYNNIIDTVVKYDYQDNIGKIKNQFENETD